ncbi:MAG TPA: tetratricopeptide repeat protein, partial [Acidobacteriota bacterium]|nr:tetratricopeptide repeat protein [Acidobacteriota bacterium]
IRKCLEKNPQDRYQSARDLFVDLKNLRRDTQTSAVRSLPQPAAQKLFRSKEVVVTLILLAMVVAGIITAQFLGKDLGLPFAKESRIRSIAVLPFENTSKNPDTEYLSDGITESLINSLSQISDLTVISRASAFRYKGQQIQPKRIADELNVQAILTGRVVQRGEQLSISAELVDAGKDQHLWGEQYNQKFSDIIAVQEEITKMIVTNLKSQLTGQQQKQLAKQHTSDPQAYQLYLKGRFYWNQATGEGTRKAIQYFNDAIERDPTYALAYAGLADSYGLILGDWYLPPKEIAPKAREAAQRALQIDPELAEPHTTLGVVHMVFDWDWVKAEKEYKRAIELNPSYATAHHQYAWFLTYLGRFAEATEEFNRAVELDPLSSVIINDQNVPYAFSGNSEEAIRLCKKAIEMDADFFLPHFALGWIYAGDANYSKALEELQLSNQLSESPMNVSWIGYALARSGRRTEALQMIQKLQETSKKRYVPPYNIAIIYVGLGDWDQAMEWLNRAYEERDGWLVFIKQEMVLRPLRSDPRFQDLLRRVGFE